MPNLRCVPKTITLAVAVMAVIAGALAGGCDRAGGGSAPASEGMRGPSFLGPDRERLQAVTFDARRPPSDSSLHALRDLGVTHLALVSFAFQESAVDPDLRFSPDVRWYSESGEGVRALAAAARELDMDIILKPQVWLRGGAWTADIGFGSESDWEVWERSYREYLLHTARLAGDIEADLLVVGTELGNPVRSRPAFWRSLIAEVRTVYDGRLTYAANWHDDYLQVPFWDALDAIGVQAYFPITATENPDLEALKEGWVPHLNDLEGISGRENLPVIFTEIGYRSVPYAAAEPWVWPSRGEDIDADYALQALLYEAFFKSVWDRSWFGGAILWKFYPEHRDRGHALDFTPQGKPAEGVIEEWFNRDRSSP